MKRTLFVFLLLIAGVFLCSCGKKPAQRTVVEITGPEGLSCIVEGIKVAQNKFRLVPRKYIMEFSAPGHRSEFRSVTVPAAASFTYKADLAPVRAAVLIKSQPAGAAVMMKGQNMGITPLVIRNLAAGEYRAELSMPGYAQVPVTWEITNERPVHVSCNLDSNYGMLLVSSTPSRARVIVDGTDVGETPFALEREEGKYVIRIERAGCTPEERNVRIRRRVRSKLHVKLGQKPGGLRVTSVPAGAELFVNGVKQGVTPCTVEGLEPGVKSVKLLRLGFDPLEEKVQIVAGTTDTRHFILPSSTGGVVFNVKPAGVELFFQGKSLGTTRALVEGAESTEDITIDNLPPGQHTVTMFHSLGDPPHQSFKFTVRKGKKTILKSRRMWIANCEVIYKAGNRERGYLLEEAADYVVFSPEPDVQYRLERSKIRGVVKLTGKKK